MIKHEAAPRNHQYIDGQPRHISSRCGINNSAANVKSQSENHLKKENVMQKVVTTVPVAQEVQAPAAHFNNKQIEILKNSICKGVSNEEFEIFLMACAKTQLDPFMRQIYAVKRKSKKADGTWGETMTIQTGIDGYRLIAERTERYAPGPEPTYVLDKNGNLVSATAYIKKMTKDGTWHTVSASAFIEEYCQTFLDKSTGEKKPTGMWANMPKTMLAKCAEAQALRKAFPAEMSGVYTKEEMQQADVEDITPKITLEQASELEMILGDCEEKYRAWVYEYIKKQYKTENLCDLPSDIYDRMKTAAVKNMEQNHSKQRQEALPAPELVAAEVQ
jgi:phage recombination protein Bet